MQLNHYVVHGLALDNETKRVAEICAVLYIESISLKNHLVVSIPFFK